MKKDWLLDFGFTDANQTLEGLRHLELHGSDGGVLFLLKKSTLFEVVFFGIQVMPCYAVGHTQSSSARLW